MDTNLRGVFLCMKHEIPLLLKPLNEQEEILILQKSFSEKIQKLEEIYQRKLEALAELKQSILQKAFTGKLT